MKGNSNYDLSFKKNNVDKKDLVYKVTNTNVPLYFVIIILGL